MKIISISFLVGIGVGLLIGAFFANNLFQPGCTLRIHFFPPSIETICPNPYEVKIAFGDSASARSLGSALKIIQDLTRGKGQARIYVQESVLRAPFASETVHPPTRSQGTISVIKQLLAEAGASDKVDICLVSGGALGSLQGERIGWFPINRNDLFNIGLFISLYFCKARPHHAGFWVLVEGNRKSISSFPPNWFRNKFHEAA